ncbi:MAG: UDP-N-acetylmuramate--L-alanine ligase [Bacteroidales bacterium]
MSKQARHIVFLGIGGIGMSALARWFKALGWEVSGYDRRETGLTQALAAEGIEVSYEIDSAIFKPETTKVVYTPALPSDHPLIKLAKSKAFPLVKRAELLGEISKGFKTIAVAGTHGKTTISTMCAHILHQSALKASALLGGISLNYSSNTVIGSPDGILVTEADEYDRSFLRLNPAIALISAMDPDHLDIYGSSEEMLSAFQQFAGKVKENGSLVVHHTLSLQPLQSINLYRYSLSDKSSDFFAGNIRTSEKGSEFRLYFPDSEKVDCFLPVPGKVNIENAIAASALSWLAGASADEIKSGLSSYRGIYRRFDILYKNDEVVYMDDYAHHPAELSAIASLAKDYYGRYNKVAIFQPHLYSRTRDLADGFAESLDKFDETFLLPVYPAREEPIPGIDSEIILKRMKSPKKSLIQPEEALNIIHRLKKPFLLLTLGAGDIDLLREPIVRQLKKKEETE